MNNKCPRKLKTKCSRPKKKESFKADDENVHAYKTTDITIKYIGVFKNVTKAITKWII